MNASSILSTIFYSTIIFIYSVYYWIFLKIQARVFFFNCIGFCLAMRIAIGIVNKHNKFDVFVCVCTLSMTL